jgi:uncharacterized protein
VIELLVQHRDAIASLCRRYNVVRLEVFGSVVLDRFDPETSDIDFLVEYAPDPDLGPWLKNHFALKDHLSALVGRPVDLIEAGAIRNPSVIETVESTRQLLYAA